MHMEYSDASLTLPSVCFLLCHPSFSLFFLVIFSIYICIYNRYKFEVLITTYEMVLKDKDILGVVPWAYLLVDEVKT
jgi:hypothetical protein